MPLSTKLITHILITDVLHGLQWLRGSAQPAQDAFVDHVVGVACGNTHAGVHTHENTIVATVAAGVYTFHVEKAE